MTPVDTLLAIVIADPEMAELLRAACEEPHDDAAVSAWLDRCTERGWPLAAAIKIRDAHRDALRETRGRDEQDDMADAEDVAEELEHAIETSESPQDILERLRRVVRGSEEPRDGKWPRQARGDSDWRYREGVIRFDGPSDLQEGEF